MLLWAICFPLITAGIAFSPHLTFAAMRALLAGVALTALALVLRRPLPTGWRTWLAVCCIGFGATGMGFLGMFHAAEFVSPGIATVIANTQPLLAALLAGTFLNEHLTARGKSGLALGFLGILVISSPRLLGAGADSYAIGIAYIALAALGVTVSNVLIKRVADDVDGLMAMGLQMLIGGVPLALGAIAWEDPAAVQWTIKFTAVLLVLSLFGSGLVYWLWFSILETSELNRANAFTFLIPVFGISIGVVFYGETVSWLQASGIVLTIAGVALVNYRRTRPVPANDFSSGPQRDKNRPGPPSPPR